LLAEKSTADSFWKGKLEDLENSNEKYSDQVKALNSWGKTFFSKKVLPQELFFNPTPPSFDYSFALLCFYFYLLWFSFFCFW